MRCLRILCCLLWWILEAVVADSCYGWQKRTVTRETIWGWKYARKYGIKVPWIVSNSLDHSSVNLVKRANFWVKELGLVNMHFVFANAMVSFEQLVSSYPGPLKLVSILCPDPHFKKRHHKRRVVQKPLVDSILKHLTPSGKIFVQSDVLEVALDMRSQLDAESDILQHIDTVDIDMGMLCDNEGWLVKNPMGIRTEREIHAEFEGARIYRRLYMKNQNA